MGRLQASKKQRKRETETQQKQRRQKNKNMVIINKNTVHNTALDLPDSQDQSQIKRQSSFAPNPAPGKG